MVWIGGVRLAVLVEFAAIFYLHTDRALPVRFGRKSLAVLSKVLIMASVNFQIIKSIIRPVLVNMVDHLSV
jgi:hypothetical protein